MFRGDFTVLVEQVYDVYRISARSRLCTDHMSLVLVIADCWNGHPATYKVLLSREGLLCTKQFTTTPRRE